MVTDTPAIKAGRAKITGRIISPTDTSKNNVSLFITVSHPVSGECVQHKVLADQSGTFSIDVDIETTVSLAGLYTSLNPEKTLLFKLKDGGLTNIDIAYNSDGDIKNVNVTPADMSKNDMTRGMEVMDKMVSYIPDRKPQPLYNKSKDYFLNFVKTSLSERLNIASNDSLISEELKGVLSKEFRLFMYNAHVFDYKASMLLNYRNTTQDTAKTPDIQKIDRSYFRFLKDFNLNDPEYLQCFAFSEFQESILQNETLGVPEIGESDIPSWLAKVKVILSDLVGFDNGPYYDILAANAYGRQLNIEVRPLTEKQKKNIVDYWGEGEIAKILFRKNKQVVELDKIKSPVVVNDVSSVPDEKIMETIVSKHKNKVIFIDLWATWCAPCLEAMKQFRTTKGDFRNKEVVFVYITNGSSPRKLWEEKIKGIGSEHYYLTASQWYYLMSHFGFEAIPSYLLYDKDGVLINKFTAFPGSDRVKEMINGLL